MAALYSIEDLLAATSGQTLGAVPEHVFGISFDSREMPEGGLFAAIKGVSMDGHRFVSDAFAAGAGLAMVSEARAGEFDGLPLLVVPDVLAGLADIAAFARARSKAKIVAVTGSVGKTTTKDALRTVLSAAGPTHAALKSFNNHWGVPLTLARLAADARFGVFEIGMSHAGEITPLAKLVRPHVSVITAIAPAHLESFGSLDEIARAKAEIFSGLEPGGVAVLNADHDQLPILVEAARAAGVGEIVSYGFSPVAEVQITRFEDDGETATARVEIGGRVADVRLMASGAHMMANAVAALIVADRFGVRLDDALGALAGFGAPAGRGEVLRLGPETDAPLTLIDESYNANPTSMQVALGLFARRDRLSGRRVLVLGDMLELGAQSARLHAALAEPIAAAAPDAVYLVGPAMAALEKLLEPGQVAGRAETVEGILPLVVHNLALGDMVMIKGSNGMRLSKLVRALKDTFGNKTGA